MALTNIKNRLYQLNNARLFVGIGVNGDKEHENAFPTLNNISNVELANRLRFFSGESTFDFNGQIIKIDVRVPQNNPLGGDWMNAFTDLQLGYISEFIVELSRSIVIYLNTGQRVSLRKTLQSIGEKFQYNYKEAMVFTITPTKNNYFELKARFNGKPEQRNILSGALQDAVEIMVIV